jgi:hypothetical protein
MSVRVQFKAESTGAAFFPGLAQPMTIDSATLPGEEAAELEGVVQAARFFDLPAVVGAMRRGAADYRQYSITVEDGGRRHSVRLTDPVEDPHLQRLLSYLRDKQKASRGAPERPPDGG